MYQKSKEQIRIQKEKIVLIENESIKLSSKLLQNEENNLFYQNLHCLIIKERNYLFKELSRQLIFERKKSVREENIRFHIATHTAPVNLRDKSLRVLKQVISYFRQ